MFKVSSALFERFPLFSSNLADYHNWLSNFLGSVQLPIVFFCAPGMVDLVKDLRGNKVRTSRCNFDVD